MILCPRILMQQKEQKLRKNMKKFGIYYAYNYNTTDPVNFQEATEKLQSMRFQLQLSRVEDQKTPILSLQENVR